ncbi:MAG: hypothetical protein KAI22_03620 [Gammaproteobacteria bacterium]|nr:hypothetical protein [Gammaproteobacteria bacterium]
MSMENQEQRDTTSTLESLLVQFNDAIKSQEELNLRISRRTSLIVQYGVLTVILLVIGIGFFSWSLRHDIDRMSGYMESMAKDASVMSNAVINMQSSMSSMEEGINNVVSHTQSISSAIIQTDNSVAVLSNIANSVNLMQNDVRGLNKSLGTMNYNLTKINKHMRDLNKKLGVMGHDVNRMSSPVKMFPF